MRTGHDPNRNPDGGDEHPTVIVATKADVHSLLRDSKAKVKTKASPT
jgi:hypothetical protein